MKAGLLVFAAVTLAGCGAATHPLDPYMMDVLQAPDACYYVDLDEDPWQQMAGFVGLESNPGAVDGHLLALDGVAPVDNRFAIMECRFQDGTSQYASAAQRFSDAAAAQAWAEAAQEEGSAFTDGARCVPQALVFTDGDVIGAIATFDSEWHPGFELAAQQRFQQILRETGAADYCA